MIDEKEINIINSLYPDFKEYADNAQFFYWMDYACELDSISFACSMSVDELVDYLNTRIRKLRSGSAGHDAAVDVASNLEESDPAKYKGVFIYG